MALTADRQTEGKGPTLSAQVEDVAASAEIFLGALVVRDATGYAAPATGAAGERVIGVAREHVDNTDGGDGDKTVLVDRKIAKFANSATNAITRQMMRDHGLAFVEDDETVSGPDGGEVAGEIVAIEDDGVFVDLRTTAPRYLDQRTATKSGAADLDPAVRYQDIEVSGTEDYALPDGKRIGDRVRAFVSAAASTPDGSITPANFADGTSIGGLDAVGDFVELEWEANGWRLVAAFGVTIS